MLQMLTGKHICQNNSTVSLPACVFLCVCVSGWKHRTEKETVFGLCLFPWKDVCVCACVCACWMVKDQLCMMLINTRLRAVSRCIGATSLSWRRRVDVLYLLPEDGELFFLCRFQNHLILKSDSCCDGFGLGMVWAGLWLGDVRILTGPKLVDLGIICIFKYLALLWECMMGIYINLLGIYL